MADLRARLYLWQTCLLALLLRAAVVYLALRTQSAAWFFSRASELGCLAASVVAGHGLGSPFGGSTGPSAFLAPGYPLLIAAIFHLFGSFSRASQIVILALQIIFSAATVATMMVCASRLFGKLTANVAGIVWAVSLPLLWVPSIFWETSFSILLATVLFALALRARDQPTWAHWMGYAAVSALALLTNPSLLTIIAACGAWAAWQAPRGLMARPLVAAAACALLCAPWVVRNALVLHAFVPLRSNSGYELWQGNHPGGEGFFQAELHPNVNSYEFRRYQELGEIAYMREKGDQAKAYIHEYPMHFLELCVKRFFSFWADARRDTTLLMTIYVIMSSALGLAGLVLLLGRDRTTGLLFLMPMIFFPLPYYLTHPDYRFRLVLDPLLVILAVYFLTQRTARKLPR